MYAFFSDIRDSTQACATLRQLRRDWVVEYFPAQLSSYTLNPERGTFLNSSFSKYEGQLFARANPASPPGQFPLYSISHLILDLLSNYGNIMAYETTMASDLVICYRVEFFDAEATERAIEHLNGFNVAVSLTVDPRVGILIIPGMHDDCSTS